MLVELFESYDDTRTYERKIPYVVPKRRLLTQMYAAQHTAKIGKCN